MDSMDSYEFDAPSHVVDFTAPEQDEMNVDEWFENRASGGINIDQQRTPIRPNGTGDYHTAPSSPQKPVDDTDSSAKPKVPSNIVTSWGTKGPTVQPKAPPAKPGRVQKRKEAQDPPEKAGPAAKKQKSSIARPPPVRRSGRQSARVVAPKAPAPKAPTVKAPTAPQSRFKSSEEEEMERIEILQKEVAEHRKKNEASYKAALAGIPPPRKAPLATTIPKEFHFSTDGRVKDNQSTDQSHEVPFTAQLRKHPSSPLKGPKGITVVKPFNLSTGNKRKGDEPAAAAPYVSMAQQIENFQKRTPDRYHLRSKQNQERGPSPLRASHLKVTEPHTPQLMTRQRNRPTNVKSTAELEAEELEKLQQFKFKALELNRKILEGALNPKKPAAKEPTKIEGFHLAIDKRAEERQAKKQEEPEENVFNFQAAPVPTGILEHRVGVPEKKQLATTVPESPAFALKHRVRVVEKVEEVKAPAPIKAVAVPHFALPFQPKLPEKSQVDVCPFSFEEREKERRAMKEKRLEEMRKEEVPKFKAQLLPDFSEVVLPEKKVVEPTKPEPFRMLIDQRGAVQQARWEENMKEEQKRQAEALCFKARPNTVTKKEPFVPKKENRSILDQSNASVASEGFMLATERRAKERQEFEQFLADGEAEKARMLEEKRREQEEREKENIAKLRQEQVHKAQPIRRFKNVEVKKSDAVLTVPQSPNFSDRFHFNRK